MTSLFPNAVIIADKFNYTRNVGDNLTSVRIQFCKSIVKKDKSIAKLIKRNLHLFDQYKKNLHIINERYHPYFKNI